MKVSVTKDRGYFRTHILVLMFVLACGCDHTRRIQQSVTLQVSPVSGDASLDCSSVSIKENTSMSGVDRRRESLSPGRFESLYSWHGPFKIDEAGRATLVIEEVMIASPSDETPPVSLHPFSGKSFLVKLDGCEEETETISIVIRRDEVASGDRYSIRVLDVSDALFLPVD